MTIEEVEKAFEKARRARQDAAEARREEHRQLLDAAEREINQKMDAKHGARIDELLVAERLARDTLDAARVVVANQQRAALPAGIVFGWALRPSHRFMRDYKWRLTGKRGVYETVTAESEFAANLAGYSIPKPGDIIVRLLRKDGTPGLQFEKMDRYHAHQWLPEGQKPKEAVEG